MLNDFEKKYFKNLDEKLYDISDDGKLHLKKEKKLNLPLLTIEYEYDGKTYKAQGVTKKLLEGCQRNHSFLRNHYRKNQSRFFYLRLQ